jgi:aryl-alcohol dehydrogenase-like predicted oxidoreductase
MQYCKLGRTDLEVSTVCCGTMAMSSRGTFGEQDDEASVRTVHAALEAGINFFDTAEGYGPGHSEEVLGRALEGRRDEVVIATKVGRNNLPERALFAACEKSLRRLRTDRIDLYQVHWANHGIPFSETAAALERLRERGKIRHWGVSNFGKLDMTEALDAGVGRPEVDQLPYSLLWRVVEHEISPICAENGVSIICYSPMAQGLLTGKFADASEVPTERARARYCVGSYAELAFGVIRELRAVSEEIGQPMADVALAWLLAQKGVACVIAGMRTPEQARENARAAEVKLPAAVIRRLTRASDALKDALGTNPDMWNEGERSRYR